MLRTCRLSRIKLALLSSLCRCRLLLARSVTRMGCKTEFSCSSIRLPRQPARISPQYLLILTFSMGRLELLHRQIHLSRSSLCSLHSSQPADTKGGRRQGEALRYSPHPRRGRWRARLLADSSDSESPGTSPLPPAPPQNRPKMDQKSDPEKTAQKSPKSAPKDPQTGPNGSPNPLNSAKSAF